MEFAAVRKRLVSKPACTRMGVAQLLLQDAQIDRSFRSAFENMIDNCALHLALLRRPCCIMNDGGASSATSAVLSSSVQVSSQRSASAEQYF